MVDKALFEKALEMPPDERLLFAELILASIDYEDDGIRESWINEIKSRMEAVSAGKVKLLDFEGIYNDS